MPGHLPQAFIDFACEGAAKRAGYEGWEEYTEGAGRPDVIG
jgi:hypothetical protein